MNDNHTGELAVMWAEAALAQAERQAQARKAGTRTYALTLGYRGEAFNGYARQPGQLTVQGELERALGVLLHRDVETVCAGRTDAGVHARRQVVSFDVAGEEASAIDAHRWLRSLNALTHDHIVGRSVDEREPGFSARFDAKARTYRYFICTSATPPLFLDRFCWHVPGELDLEAMGEAAMFLEGEQDFKSFCKAESAEGKSTFRNVSRTAVERVDMLDEDMVCIEVEGNAFLHNMVRTMVGTLVMVGRGKRPSRWVFDVLDAHDRRAAGETAPAAGLVLWDVKY